MEPIAQFTTRALAVARPEFVLKNPHSFLIIQQKPGDSGIPEQKTTAVRAAASREEMAEKSVVPIAKAEGKASAASPTGKFISLGRTQNNDIVLSSPYISKTHLLFKPVVPGRVFCYDAGSTNGTTLNGTRLQPNAPATLKDGDELLLSGVVLATYFTAGGIYDYLGLLSGKR